MSPIDLWWWWNVVCHVVMGQENEQANMGRTSIQVSDELADELHSRKDRGESYEDVIWRLIRSEENDRE